MTILREKKETENDKRKTSANTHAKMMLDSQLQSAATIGSFSSVATGDSETSIVDLFNVVSDKNKAINDGDLTNIETMLFSQAISLDNIFHELLRCSAQNIGEYPQAFERYMRLGLKAQSQSRSTLEALAEIKQPRSVTIAKQANIADQQIVNNGNSAMNAGKSVPAHGKNKQKMKNELLGVAEHDSLDTRATTTTIKINQDVETVGAINRC